MRFVLVKTTNDLQPKLEWPWQRYRATAARDDGKFFDLFFCAVCERSAKEHVRRRFPDASFYGEVLQ
jgi:hypothetical protein